MGAALLAEYEDVLGRASLWSKCRLSTVEREDLLDIFLARCTWTRIYFGWRPNLRDEGDNHLVELAVAGGAGCIVTRNVRDLISMELELELELELEFPALTVRTPEQFLKEPTS
jgi:uncharacterized protein